MESVSGELSEYTVSVMVLSETQNVRDSMTLAVTWIGVLVESAIPP